MQHEDFMWFIENYDKLYQKYGNKFLAVRDKKVIGAYESYAEGVREASKVAPPGSFIVQECNGDASAYHTYIASNYA